MTFGDKIREMSDRELAEVIICSIEANSDCFEEYRVDLGGYWSFNVTDVDDLAEILGNEVVGDE